MHLVKHKINKLAPQFYHYVKAAHQKHQILSSGSRITCFKSERQGHENLALY